MGLVTGNRSGAEAGHYAEVMEDTNRSAETGATPEGSKIPADPPTELPGDPPPGEERDAGDERDNARSGDAPRPAPEDPHAVRPFTRKSVLLLTLFGLGVPALLFGFLMVQYLLIWWGPR